MKKILLLIFFFSINIFCQDLLLTSIKSDSKILTGYIIIDGKECPIYKTVEPNYLGDNCKFFLKNYILAIEIKKDSILEEIFEKEIFIDSTKFFYEEESLELPEKYDYFDLLYRIKIKENNNIIYSNYKFIPGNYLRLVLYSNGISIYPSIKENSLFKFLK